MPCYSSLFKLHSMKPFLSTVIAIGAITIFSFSQPETRNQKPETRKIQVAILLDVSNSMDGLIEQAKAQLWDMVITLGKTQCTDKSTPKVELALYEYGRPANGADKGYIRQLSPFTNDLDSVSKLLFSIVTNGGDEFCGQVIYKSMDELNWDKSPDNYKVIFIAGNEDFLQGNVQYTEGCNKAKTNGIIVNTIYCGPYDAGVREHWNLGSECGKGSYTNIDQNAKEIVIPTPYDSTLMVLNTKLNGTYIGFGYMASGGATRQMEADALNSGLSTNVQAKRVAAKSSSVYNNASWDMIDAYKADSSYLKKLKKDDLADSLKQKSTKELEALVKEKSAERGAVQTEITKTILQRNDYIAAEKARMATKNNEPTLESAINKILKEQVRRFKMVIE
jgi:hypothetical protein